MTDPYTLAVERDVPATRIRFLNNAGTDMWDGGPVTLVNGATISTGIVPSNSSYQALSLDGVNDYATAGGGLWWVNTGSCTLSLFCQPDVITGTRTMIYRDGDYSLKLVNGIPQASITIPAGTFVVNGTVPLVAGQTYHIVMLFRSSSFWGSVLHLFVNGEQVGTTSVGTANLVRTRDASTLFLGSLNGTSEFFDGKLAEIYYFQTHVGVQRIKEYYEKAFNIFAQPVRPYNETWVDLIDTPWPPGWKNAISTNRGVPSYGISWDHKGVQAAPGATNRGSALSLLTQDRVPYLEWDIIVNVFPPAATNEIQTARVWINHDGSLPPNTTEPWNALRGYCLDLYRNADGTTAACIYRYDNYVGTILGGIVAGPAWDGTQLKMRLRRTDNMIKFKVWPAANPEPPTWHTRVDPGTPLGPGYVGLNYINGTSGTAMSIQWGTMAVRGRVHENFAIIDGVERPLLDYISTNMEWPLVVTAPD